MWPSQNPKYLQPSVYTKRRATYVDRFFQVKYIRYIITMAVISSLALLLPAMYFANQNYSIFYRLADLMNPELARYISKEQIGLNVAFLAAFVANLFFWAILCKKVTGKIAGPAKVLRNHIRLVGRGHYTLEPIRLREEDEFKELVNTYNYLYTLLKVQSQKELEQLRAILPSVTNPIAHRVIEQMADERAARLQDGTAAEVIAISPGAKRDSTRDSRHVS